MKKIILLFVLIMLPLVSAYSTINIYVDNSGNAVFLGEGSSGNINLPKGIEFKDGRILGTTQDLTNKIGEIWDFSYSLEASEVQIFLPEGVKVLKTNGEISLFKNQIVIYGINETNIKYVLGKDSKSNNFFLIIFFIIGIAFIIYFVFKRKNRDKSKSDFDKIKAIQGILNERERLILDKLRESGKIKSSYLRKKTEIPKASFSRHIRELEKKGLVKFSGEGRNKFVELK